jgi:hypothetical protein
LFPEDFDDSGASLPKKIRFKPKLRLKEEVEQASAVTDEVSVNQFSLLTGAFSDKTLSQNSGQNLYAKHNYV